MKRLALGAMLTPALLLIASPAVVQQQEPIVPDTAAITTAAVDLGRALFHGKGTCFMCHGAKLEGTQVAPTLKQHKWRDAKDGKLDEIFRVATHGVPSTVMVAFPGGISRAEALNVASYIWSVSNRGAKP
jgi:mono/diheme cytochrome c family protein